jgi:hypothetical protein
MSYSINNIPSPTYTVSTSGTSTSVSGAYLVSNGSGYNTWATTSLTGQTDLTPNSLQVKGKSEFEDDVNIIGDLKLQGKSLKDSLDKIEEKLAILHPNEELEEKWENLRGLRKMYMELEAEIKEKEAMWSILKK